MARKLFLYDDPPYTTVYSLPSPPLHHHRPATANTTSSSPPSSSKKLPQHTSSPAFDSSMALTVVVLLTALFFMGFFSIYIRRLYEDDPTTADHLSRRRRFRAGPLDMFSSSSDRTLALAPRKGLDPATVGSLPVYSYHGDAKYQIDCAICLSEFEDRECVKTIPRCKHVFHVECIDAWLSSHLSCPVCRETRLFETKDDDELGQSGTVDIGDTSSVTGTVSMVRRTNSWSSLGPQAMLRRTLSF